MTAHHERRTLAKARVAVAKGYSATERGGVPVQRVSRAPHCRVSLGYDEA